MERPVGIVLYREREHINRFEYVYFDEKRNLRHYCGAVVDAPLPVPEPIATRISLRSNEDLERDRRVLVDAFFGSENKRKFEMEHRTHLRMRNAPQKWDPVFAPSVHDGAPTTRDGARYTKIGSPRGGEFDIPTKDGSIHFYRIRRRQKGKKSPWLYFKITRNGLTASLTIQKEE